MTILASHIDTCVVEVSALTINLITIHGEFTIHLEGGETILLVLHLGGTEGTHCYQLKKWMSDLQKAVGELEKKHARKGVANVGDMEEE